MKKIKRLISSAILLGSLSVSLASVAGECDGITDWRDGGNDTLGHGGKRIETLLDLSDAQRTTLKNQRNANVAARHVLHKKIRDARDALAAAVESGANNAELAALADTLGKLHAEQAIAGAKNRKAFIDVLTKEQKQKWNDFKAKREEQRQAREER